MEILEIFKSLKVKKSEYLNEIFGSIFYDNNIMFYKMISCKINFKIDISSLSILNNDLN